MKRFISEIVKIWKNSVEGEGSEKLQKHMKNVREYRSFLRAICWNHERIPHNSLFTGTNCSQLLPNPAYLCRWIHACNIVKPADEIYIYTYLHAVDIIKPADEIFLYLNDIFGWIHACDIVEPCGWHCWMDPSLWHCWTMRVTLLDGSS